MIKDKKWALAQYHLNNIIVNHYGRSNMYANTRGGGCSHALESAISLTYLYFIQHSIYSTGQEKRQFLCWGFQLDDTSPLFCLWRGKDKLRHSPSEIFFLFLYQILRYDHFLSKKLRVVYVYPELSSAHQFNQSRAWYRATLAAVMPALVWGLWAQPTPRPGQHNCSWLISR